jgi:hypothetical protein
MQNRQISVPAAGLISLCVLETNEFLGGYIHLMMILAKNGAIWKSNCGFR